MAKSVIVAYEVDAWHTHASKTLIGVFTSKFTAIRIIKKDYKWKWLRKDDIEELINNDQTYGHDTNILFEEYDKNKIQ